MKINQKSTQLPKSCHLFTSPNSFSLILLVFHWENQPSVVSHTVLGQEKERQEAEAKAKAEADEKAPWGRGDVKSFSDHLITGFLLKVFIFF